MTLTVRRDGRPLGLDLSGTESQNGAPAPANPVLCDPLALDKHKKLLPRPARQPRSLVEVFAAVGKGVGGVKDDGSESQSLERHEARDLTGKTVTQ